MFQYFDKIVKGTEREDSLIIIQNLKSMIGTNFSFLNYYKEIPVSYDAKLVNVDNEMAEFEVHEYQAKVITLEHKALIRAHEKFSFREDMIGEAFYVNAARKKVILCNFGYAKIRSDMRRFVRVVLDRSLEAEMIVAEDIIKGSIKDISLGGASISVMSKEQLPPGLDINVFLKLPDIANGSVHEVGVTATVIKVVGTKPPITVFWNSTRKNTPSSRYPIISTSAKSKSSKSSKSKHCNPASSRCPLCRHFLAAVLYFCAALPCHPVGMVCSVFLTY
ncbi:PilZ domain-containing protein [Geobacter sp. FeAm09]|uniref:PilZ domain-containing protein n=1 Tax=Geobacter sp. FeAm09 TaxID=2597769 RepID=UPI0011EC8B44|nr:PilZ domain-containing protein [Geobacter sp. FeAm09]QEM68353.1 PilZ domain-containing protein [Geobacter sp. FeAm09]